MGKAWWQFPDAHYGFAGVQDVVVGAGEIGEVAYGYGEVGGYFGDGMRVGC